MTHVETPDRSGTPKTELKRFELHQRVRVHHTHNAVFLGGAHGTVVRLRRSDGAAWIQLDTLSTVPNAHPFPETDPVRARHVLAYPPGCSVIA